MRILIDARSMGQRPSGIGMYLYNFAKELIKEKEVELHLVSDVDESNEIRHMKQMGATIHCCDRNIGKNLGLFKYYRFLQSKIHEVKPDIFWEGNNLVPIKVTNPYGKFVTTIHDLFPITLPQYYGKKYMYYFWYGLRNTLKYADVILYNSEETRSEMERIFPKAKKIQNFISYIIVDDVDSKEVGEEDYFLYVGNLEKRKGTDLLIEGYRKYLELGGDLRLRMGGKIREEDIQEMVDSLIAKTKKAEYIGYLSKEEKEKEYGHCRAFLFPSKAEGFGMPVVEVMNYKKPIIASDLSIFKELVGDAINYFPLSDNKDEMAEKLAEAMLQYQEPDGQTYAGIVQKYSARVLGCRLLECFRKISE